MEYPLFSNVETEESEQDSEEISPECAAEIDRICREVSEYMGGDFL